MSGELNLELAKSYFEDGNTKKAFEHLNIANEVWSNADSSFKLAIEARKKMLEWNQIN